MNNGRYGTDVVRASNSASRCGGDLRNVDNRWLGRQVRRIHATGLQLGKATHYIFGI